MEIILFVFLYKEDIVAARQGQFLRVNSVKLHL
jgi:hypothetical protein